MIIILTGIVIFVGITLLLQYTAQDSNTLTWGVVMALIIGITAILVGIFVPVQGYEESEFVKETQLVSLSNDTVSQGSKGIFYVSISADNVYSYRYEVDDNYGLSGKAYKVGTVSKNVTEVESSECKVPVLKVYNKKGKKGLFTFAAFTDETEYVFYVPEGTIVKEISLN